MGITYGDHLIDSGYYDITPEQEREIERKGTIMSNPVDSILEAWFGEALENMEDEKRARLYLYEPLRKEFNRLQETKRRALKLADERAIEAVELRAALKELHAMVMGECPSLLDEDSGGNARLDADIHALLDPVSSAKGNGNE